MNSKRPLSGAGTLSLVWTRKDLPFEQCFEYWRGPHGQLVGHNKSAWSYRQLHFDREAPLQQISEWHVEQSCPKEWIPDGIAECLCTNLLRGLTSKYTKNAKLTFKDEQNAFERTLLYMAMPWNAVFQVEKATDTALNGEACGSRVAILLKCRGLRTAFNRFFNKQLIPALRDDPCTTELHSYLFAPYDENSWPGENIVHDQPKELQYDAALILGAADRAALLEILNSSAVTDAINANSGMIALAHVFNIRLTLVMRYADCATLAAVRGAQVCDVLMAANAQNQVSDAMINYMFKRF